MKFQDQIQLKLLFILLKVVKDLPISGKHLIQQFLEFITIFYQKKFQFFLMLSDKLSMNYPHNQTRNQYLLGYQLLIRLLKNKRKKILILKEKLQMQLKDLLLLSQHQIQLNTTEEMKMIYYMGVDNQELLLNLKMNLSKIPQLVLLIKRLLKRSKNNFKTEMALFPTQLMI